MDCLLRYTACVLLSCSVALAPAVLAQIAPSSSTSTSATAACPTVLSPSYSAPVVGSGWTAQLVARNLTSPRSILLDGEGALLVVQQGVGVLRVRFDDYGGTCPVVNSTETVVANPDVREGPLVCSCCAGRMNIKLTKTGEVAQSRCSDVCRWEHTLCIFF